MDDGRGSYIAIEQQQQQQQDNNDDQPFGETTTTSLESNSNSNSNSGNCFGWCCCCRLDWKRKLLCLSIVGLILVVVGGVLMTHYFHRSSKFFSKEESTISNWFEPSSRHHHHSTFEESSSTFLHGGGRDWILHKSNGTIVSKHIPELALGMEQNPSLCLVPRGSSRQLIFDSDETLMALQDGRSVAFIGKYYHTSTEKIDVVVKRQFTKPKNISGTKWQYIASSVLPTQTTITTSNQYHKSSNNNNNDDVLMVSYIHDNFLQIQHQEKNDNTASDDDHDDLTDEFVFDVANNWRHVAETSVNFVRSSSSSSSSNINETTTTTKLKSKKVSPTLQRGGGRDWILNLNDGTIGCRHAPHLVLGIGLRRMILVNTTTTTTITTQRNSATKNNIDDDDEEEENGKILMFDQLEALSLGAAVPLTIQSDTNNNNNPATMAVGKLYEKPHFIGPWHYIESAIVPLSSSLSLGKNIITVRYVDNNYLWLEDENMVLDVSQWIMEKGNTVNFVGGTP